MWEGRCGSCVGLLRVHDIAGRAAPLAIHRRRFWRRTTWILRAASGCFAQGSRRSLDGHSMSLDSIWEIESFDLLICKSKLWQGFSWLTGDAESDGRRASTRSPANESLAPLRAAKSMPVAFLAPIPEAAVLRPKGFDRVGGPGRSAAADPVDAGDACGFQDAGSETA